MALTVRYLLKPRLSYFIKRLSTCTESNSEFLYSHTPVMSKEVLEALAPKKNEVFLDMTFGAGGHTKQILDSAPGVTVFALDRDPEAISRAHSLALDYPRGRLIPLHGRFSEVVELLNKHHYPPLQLDGVLMDLGCSSMQMDDPSRGFSLSKMGSLDMRMDGRDANDVPTAQDLVNSLEFEDLAQIFKIYGEERLAKKIAQAIIDARFMRRTILTTKDLATVVYTALGKEDRRDRLNRKTHQATKVFQALRIFVNDELNELEFGLRAARYLLRTGGRLAALSFHSLEDRIVKHHLAGIDPGHHLLSSLHLRFKNPDISFPSYQVETLASPRWIVHPMVEPSEEEVETNPRARSAKLRSAEKLPIEHLNSDTSTTKPSSE